MDRLRGLNFPPSCLKKPLQPRRAGDAAALRALRARGPRCGSAPRSAAAHGRMGSRALGAADESGARPAAPGARGSHGPLLPAPPMASPLVRAGPRPTAAAARTAGRRSAAGGYRPARRAAWPPPPPLVGALRTPGAATPAARGALAAAEGRGRASVAAPARSLTVRTLSPGGPRPDPAFPRPHGCGDGRCLQRGRGGAG